jgi:hypothetical protein
MLVLVVDLMVVLAAAVLLVQVVIDRMDQNQVKVVLLKYIIFLVHLMDMVEAEAEAQALTLTQVQLLPINLMVVVVVLGQIMMELMLTHMVVVEVVQLVVMVIIMVVLDVLVLSSLGIHRLTLNN